MDDKIRTIKLSCKNKQANEKLGFSLRAGKCSLLISFILKLINIKYFDDEK